MTTITPDEMKSLETLFMSETGTPSILLMEHAAQGVAAALSRHAPKSARVLFLCGPGNNGGDGYAAARLWCSGGGQADVTSAVRGDALTNRTLALLHGVRILPSADAVDVAEYAAVVDALYGTGLNHAIEGDAAILIHRLSDHPQIPVIAVDIPSGLDGTTGRALGADVVRAAETVTFHRIKQGLLLRQGVEYTGKITIHMGEINDLGGICLSLFLGIAMITLKLWQLADLALPLIIMLGGQVLLMFLYSYFVVYRIMGRDYDSAVLTAGMCGFGMGATPNAMANMQAICEKYTTSVKAYLLIPLVGSLFADFINSLVITFFINII